MDSDAETQIETETETKTKTKTKKRKRKVSAAIQVVHEHPDRTAPIVGYFPSGFDPHRQEDQNPARVRVFRNKNRTNRVQVVVSPTRSKVDFVGTNYAGEAATGQPCTYALGVFDKDTHMLKIVPITSNKIFRLEPRVRGSEPSDKEPSRKAELTPEKRLDRLRELNQLYGTKRSIIQDTKFETLNQREDPSSQQNLDSKLKDVVVNKDALASARSSNARNIPPYDSSATTPEEAYPLEKIILAGEWDYLLDILELLQVGAEVAPNAYPSFVCNRIDKLKMIKDETKKRTLACIFSYITHLVKFKDQHSMDGASSAKHHKIPSILRQKFSAMFKDTDSKRLSDEKNALLISYVLVLTLFADEFRTDLADIARDLRMSPAALRLHYEHLGCKFSREKNMVFTILPVPLKFPELKRRRRK